MRKYGKRILLVLLTVLAISVGAFLLYTSDYYRADPAVMRIAEDSGTVISKNNTITLIPPVETDTGIIFYPGAKVEYTAYLPLMQKLQQKGYLCVLVQMPFNLAILNLNAADGVYSQYPEIEHWVLAGHSLGGAMASSYLSDHPEKADGLILLGAYVYGSVPTEETLVLYGSEDMVLDRAKLSGSDNEVEIEGGNHAQFGNYGAQAGDGSATISAEEQQNITVEKIDAFINQLTAGDQ